MEENAENLVIQNPRDSLILRRQKNLAILKEKHASNKYQNKLHWARTYYENFLKEFASEFLAVNDKDVFDSLSPQEKRALNKLCTNTCWFRLTRHTSIFTAFFGTSITLGIVLNPGWFFAVGISGFIYSVLTLWDFPISYIKFLRAKRILEGILDKNQKG